MKFLRSWSYEKVADEQILRRKLVDYPEFAPVLRIGACEAIEYVHLVSAEKSDHLLLDCVEDISADRAIDFAPVDYIVDTVSVNNVLVMRGSAGEFSGRYGQRAGVCKNAFAVPDRLFNQNCRAQISPDRRCSDAERRKAIVFAVILVDGGFLLISLCDRWVDHEDALLHVVAVVIIKHIVYPPMKL